MVYVIFSKDKRNIERSKGLQWSYLGADEGLSRVEALLGGDKREFIGREIDRVVSLVRDNFVDYIGLTSTLQKDKVLWYSARAASKSFSQTTMFQQYIYIKLIESYAASEGSHLFIIDDFRLLANLELARLPDVMVQSRAVPDLTDIALNKAKGVLRSFRFIFYWVAFKLIFSSEAPKGGDILLHSFIDSRIFSRLPEYNDPYFGELAGFLDKNGHNVLRVTPLSVSLKHAFIIKKHFKNTIFLLSYLKLSDYLRVLFTRMSIKCGLPEDNDIRDKGLLDLLLKNEEKNENMAKGFHTYLFCYYSYRRLAEKIPSGAPIIYTFENQPWEKMLNLALGRNFKKIAYQHTIIHANWLDYRVSVFEKGSPVPDVILASGKKWLDFLKKYYPSCRMENAGAIRLNHIFSRPRNQRIREDKIIAVALPIMPEIAIQLQKQLLACLAGGGFNGYKFLIKPHPYLLKSAFFTKEFLRYDNCEITDKGMDRLLENCSLLVTSGSTAAFEALSLGVKTLYFIPETISIGSEYLIREYLELAYADDFREKLVSALKVTAPAEFKAEEFFSPPDYTVFLRQI